MSQIIRVLKRKTKQAIGAMSNHNDRKPKCENYYPNADPSRKHLNYYLKGSSNASADAKERLDEIKFKRKNAVLAIEFLITASPKQLKEMNEQEQKKYFEDSVKWLEKKHGKENIVNAVVHRDEESPHMHVTLIPEHEGKLNSSHFFGSPEKMRGLWTEFNDEVAHKYGLERNTPELDEVKAKAKEEGIEFKQKHVTLRKYYRDRAKEAYEVIERAKEIIDEKNEELANLDDEISERLQSLAEKQAKQEQLIAKNIEKFNKVSQAGNKKLEELSKLEKRIETYKKRLEAIEVEKTRLEQELQETRAASKTALETLVERKNMIEAADSVDDLERYDAIVESGIFANKTKPGLLVSDVKSFLTKKIEKIEMQATARAREQIESDVRAESHNEKVDYERRLDSYKKREQAFEARESALNARIEAYEAVMTTEQKTRAESKIKARMQQRNNATTSLRM